MYVIVTCKYEKDPIKNSREKVATPFSPYNPMGAICCHGNKSEHQIWSVFFMFDSKTHSRGRRLESYPISSPCFGSGELKTKNFSREFDVLGCIGHHITLSLG